LKDKLYRGGFHIFPNEEKVGSFDELVTAHAKNVLLDTARKLEKPTILNISIELGMLRDRVARLMRQLEIRDQYLEIKSEKMNPTKEE